MTEATLADLQASVKDRSAFGTLPDYFTLCEAFLRLVQSTQPTRIVSPSHHNYIFYQYDEAYGHRITRPLNVDLFIESASDFTVAFERFIAYQLDLVFSRNKAIVAAETKFIHVTEIVGSVKTTSKDRIDKVFLDKYLLKKLLGRNVPVVAVFLHDVQRARRGKSIFGINSTFKSNHFLGYTVALSRLDGVYYVDPRPEMVANERLREQIADFQKFLVKDLWTLSSG